MSDLRRIYGMAALVLGGATGLLAQTLQDPNTGSLDPWGSDRPSARAAAMGSAWVGIAGDAADLFFNPAGLSSLARGQVSLQTDLGWTDSFEETFLAALPAGSLGGVGLAGSYLTYGSLPGRDNLGSVAPSYGSDRLSLRLGWGKEMEKRIALGGAFRFSRQSIAETSYDSFGPELGLWARPLDPWGLGLDYTLGGWGTWSGSRTSWLRAGSSWRCTLDPSSDLLAAVAYRLGSNGRQTLQAGAELSWMGRFFLRAGYSQPLQDEHGALTPGYSLGGGLVWKDFLLDYAFCPGGELGSDHRFSLGYLFGGPDAAAPSRPSTDPSIAGKAGRSEDRNPGTGLGAVPPEKGAKEGTWTAPPPVLSPPRSEATPSKQERLVVAFSIPSDPTSQGDALASRGRFQEAIPLYRQAIAQDPHDILAWWGLGNVYYRSKQKKEAIACFQKVLELKPGDQALTEWLAQYQKP